MRFVVMLSIAVSVGLLSRPDAVTADGGAAGRDSVYLVGEFVDPICIYQHGMQGVAQKTCALVPGRVEQGIYFLDIRERHIYPVIGVDHWKDPQAEFGALLGDTVAVVAKVWNQLGSEAISVVRIYPIDEQPAVVMTWWPWSWEWSVLLGVALLGLLYALAVGPWRARLGATTDFEGTRAIAFFAGLVLVVISLNGPIHDISDQYLFSTHMVQHLILAQAFPPLFLFGVPPWLWQRLHRTAGLGPAWRFSTRAPRGFLAYTLVFAIWHVPLLYNLMMRDHSFHILMHLMVMGTGVLLWWPLLAVPEERRLSPPARMLYLFVLGVPMSAVAAFITFAQQPLYEWYALAPRLWGLSPVDDQRLGGLIMWVPGAWLYWGMMTAIFFRWAASEERADRAPRPMPQRAGG